MNDDSLTWVDVLNEEAEKLHGIKGKPNSLEELYKAIHGLDPCRAALCLSGGGIRSATFCLGVIQGLARAGWLKRFHYLSTVSGGGYIGGWLSAWIHSSNLDSVVADLCPHKAPSVTVPPSGSAVSPESKHIRWLRALSNYLSPRIGFSADFWTLIAVVLRNLLLHWVVFIPLLAAALMLPRATFGLSAHLDPPSWIRWAAFGLALSLGAVGLAFVETDLPSSNREPSRRPALYFLASMLVGAFLLSLFWAWHSRMGPGGFGFWECAGVGVGVNCAGVILGKVVRACRKRNSDSPESANSKPVLTFFKEAAAVALSGALGGVVLWVGSTQLFPRPIEVKGGYACFAVPFLFAALSIGSVLYIGLGRRFTSEEDREWWASAGGWGLMTITLWVASHALVIYGPPALLSLGEKTAAYIVSLGGLTGVATAVWAYLSKATTVDLVKTDSIFRRMLTRVGPTLGSLAFALILLLLISLATSLLLDPGKHLSAIDGSQATIYNDVLSNTSPGVALTILAGCLAIALVFSWLMGINTFSLHSMYGNRLVRAYLGAARGHRTPHPFTGFDPHDNVSMSELWPADASAPRGPLHIVNLALNLVKADRLEWQQRKAESFTVSPLHSGSLNLGYRRSAFYGGAQGMSLGRAITISGAAASPNMGYHSSTIVAFLMTFFNLRLGWWLPNPGKAGEGVWERSEPGFGLIPLVAEALGRTTDQTSYVYLSDGGHFENLALYEMVFRRCGLIVLVDAGCDPKYEYEDLAGAVRKIRNDLGIPITFSGLPRPAGEKEPGSHYGIGTVHYTEVGEDRDGTIIYIKPVLTGDEDVDVRRYAAAHKKPKNPFPQQSTMDQFFDEAQFESYRKLGEHSVLKLFKQKGGSTTH